MNQILNLLGPTATESEHKLLTEESGNMEVARMKETLEANIAQQHANEEYDRERLTSLQEYEAEAFPMLQQRGVTLAIDIFNHQMDQVIEAYRLSESAEEAVGQERRKQAINQNHPETEVIHPLYSTLRSRTGRITVSNPAIQGWKSNVRTAILPSDPRYSQVYSLDFKAYDPTVLAVLSKDSQLEQDIQSDDLYRRLLEAVGISDGDQHRTAMKQTFLASFINGGQPEYFLKKHGLPLSKQEWVKVQQRYSTARQYIEDVNRTGQASSLNGITYRFKQDDDAKFSKFIQHEAAFIFRNVFAEVLKNESTLGAMTLLPIHDEILIAVQDPESMSQIQHLMTGMFKEVTGSSLAKVESTLQGGDENA